MRTTSKVMQINRTSHQRTDRCLMVAATLLILSAVFSVPATAGMTQVVPFGNGGRLKITVTKVVDPLPYTPRSRENPFGERFARNERPIGIRLRFANISRVPYRFHLYPGFSIYGSNKKKADRFLSIAGCDTTTLNTTIAPHSITTGCEGATLRRGVRATRLVLTNLDTYVEWQLPRSTTTRR